MSDQTTTVDPSISAVTQDAVDAAVFGKKALAAYKSSGVSGLSALLGEAVTVIEKDYTDVKAALPSIKSGYKTTEFWLIVGVGLANGLYTVFSGKTLPIDLNVVAAALIAVYTAARALTKSATPTTAVVTVAAK
jgi:hypothetical protein